MDSDLTIPAVRGMLEAAREAGMDLASLSELRGHEPGRDRCVWGRLMRGVMQAVGVDGFPIRVAQRTSIGEIGALGMAARIAPDLHGAFQRLQVFTGTLLAPMRDDVARGTTILEHLPIPGTDLGSRCRRELRVATTLQFARDVSGVLVRPRRVCFSHAEPRDLREHDAFFDCELRFDADYDGLEFDLDTLAIALPGADTDLSDVLVDHLLAISGTPQAVPTLEDKVRQALRARLGNQAPTPAVIAQDLGMSTRTLRRRLHEQRTGYHEILDGVRRELADELLAEPDHGIKEVAFLIGFSDASAFHRAYRRWTGQTPATQRRELHGDA